MHCSVTKKIRNCSTASSSVYDEICGAKFENDTHSYDNSMAVKIKQIWSELN